MTFDPTPPPGNPQMAARTTYRLTRAQRAWVLKAYNAGLKCEYIAAAVGIRRESVSKLARRAGSPPRFPTMSEAHKRRHENRRSTT